jgi:hypothetical protein
MDEKSGGSRVARALLRSLDIHLHRNHLGAPQCLRRRQVICGRPSLSATGWICRARRCSCQIGPGYKLVQLQVRADATNAFNHPSFGPPNQTLAPESTPDPSGITTFAGTGTSISQVTVGDRTMQLDARLTF